MSKLEWLYCLGGLAVFAIFYYFSMWDINHRKEEIRQEDLDEDEFEVK